MPPRKTILVTGASGWIGRHVCTALQAKDCFVLAADLRESSGPWDAFLPLDITQSTFPNLESLLSLTQGHVPSAVIHCAGLAHQAIETPELIERFFAVNAHGTRNVLAACETWGIPRLVYVSSIAFYDWSQSQPLTEDAPISASTAYAASKLEGENAVLESTLDGRVARLATVFGEGDPANFAKLAKALKAGQFLVPGKGTARKSVIPVELAADCLAEMAVRDIIEHKLINLGLMVAPTLHEICTAFTISCNFPAAKALPLPLFRLLALAGDVISKLKPQFPLTSTNLRKLTTSTQVDCKKAAGLFPKLGVTKFESELARFSSFYLNR